MRILLLDVCAVSDQNLADRQLPIEGRDEKCETSLLIRTSEVDSALFECLPKSYYIAVRTRVPEPFLRHETRNRPPKSETQMRTRLIFEDIDRRPQKGAA